MSPPRTKSYCSLLCGSGWHSSSLAGGRGSAFVSDSFEQARPDYIPFWGSQKDVTGEFSLRLLRELKLALVRSTQQGAMTLEEFIRRERAERTGSSRAASLYSVPAAIMPRAGS